MFVKLLTRQSKKKVLYSTLEKLISNLADSTQRCTQGYSIRKSDS